MRQSRDRCGYSTCLVFFFNDTATTEIYTLSLHDALPILTHLGALRQVGTRARERDAQLGRSEEHTSELQSLAYLVCRLLLRKKQRTSELQSLAYLVCRLLLEKQKQTAE